jgi:alkanesulfonate monooxygenase SsuD/methylene tetrahydromethanopterin reductase-like flavin-dependent oxidoreductase (luciferase family)
MDVGLGLWTMRSTAAYPASYPQLYAQLRADAVLAEDLGFHSLWTAEHHFWYDGWCPTPLAAAATVLAATTRLHAGTGIHLLPLHEPGEVARELEWLQRLSGGRLEYGVGLGYRAGEYDGYGLSRRARGRRMDAALDHVLTLGDACPRVWVGGMAEAALRRAASRGLGVMLPSTLRADQLKVAVEQVRAVADELGTQPRLGIMKYTWATDGTEAGRVRAEEALSSFTREYSGSWFPLKGRPGFEVPDLLDAQMRRSADTALIGSPAEIAETLAGYAEVGVELTMLHLVGDARLPDHRDNMALIADSVLPAVQGVRA